MRKVIYICSNISIADLEQAFVFWVKAVKMNVSTSSFLEIGLR